MNRTIIFITLQFLLSTIILAQTSIGFKNKHHIKPISDYRLPQWGYSTILLDGWGMTKSSYNESNHGKADNFEYQLLMKPSLLGYHESENYIQNYQVNLSLDNHYKTYQINPKLDSNAMRENREMKYDITLDLKGSRKQYFLHEGFLLIDGTYNYIYQDHKTKEKTAENETDYRGIANDYKADIKLGIGFGRIRNISPLIRALRWRERFEALRDSFVITDDKIQLVGQEFSKISGYEVIYDRKEKYFWNNLFNHIDPNQSLTPFETFYLTDVLYENIGERFEGWEISAALDKMTSKYKAENIGGIMKVEWYKNLSLENQLNMTSSVSYQKNEYKNKSVTLTQQIIFEYHTSVNYLWLLTDRIYWNSRIDHQYFHWRDQNQSPVGFYNKYYKRNIYKFSSRLSYYIENGMNFFIDFNYNFNDYMEKHSAIKLTRDENSHSLQLNFGFHYIFNQKLF
ncbi:hypothetical protein JW964_18300 [candidate division KSB1 bacterium]|nr:hypothetical protein [candidate division KSB1 bacterium]